MKIKFPLRKNIFIGIDPSPTNNNGMAIINDSGNVETRISNQATVLFLIEKFATKENSFMIERIFIEDYENRNDINQFSNNGINVFIGQIIQICDQNAIDYKMVKAAQHKFLFRECKGKKEKIDKLKEYYDMNLEEVKKLNNHIIDALSIVLWGAKQRKTRSKNCKVNKNFKKFCDTI